MAIDDGRQMNSTKAVLALLFTMLVWGIAPVFIRNLSTELGPSDALVIRYIIVGLIYGIGLYVTGMKRVASADWKMLLLISIVGMLGYNLGSVFGFECVPAGVGGLIIGTQPLLIAVLAAVLTRETLTVATMVGLGVSFLGTALLFSSDLSGGVAGSSQLLGGILIFLSGLAWALYVVLARPLIRAYGAFQVSALTIMIATLPMLLLLRPGTVDTVMTMTPRLWFEMFFMVILATVVSAVTWNYGAGRLSSIATGTFLYLVPVLAVAAGAIILDEAVTPGMVVGGVLILLGVAIAQFADRWPLAGFSSARSSSTLRAYSALLFSVVMWGCVPVAIRYLVVDLRPDTVLLLRLFPTGILAISLLVFIGSRPIAGRDWPRILVAALVGNCGYQVLVHFGIKTVPASWTGMLFGLEPLFIALFALVLSHERATPQLWAGMAVALAGTALLAYASLSGTSDVGLTGLAMVFVSTMGWGIYTVVLRPVAEKYGVLEISCLTLAISALPMIGFLKADVGATVERLTLDQWAAVAFLILFGTFLAVIFWNYGVNRIGSARAGVFLYLQPLVAAVGGALLLGESITWVLVVGGLLILAGVAIAEVRVQLFSPRPQEAAGKSLERRAAVERLVASARTARND